ncbi:hypothetical protein [Furfurilactobacillus siliginis]|nr:hypothetical protein [Furfurilactobacillus siliginis]
MQLLNSNDFVKNPKSIYFNGLELKNKYNLTQMDSNPNHIQLVRQIELSDNHLIEEVETAIIQLWSRNLKEIEKETMDEVITGKDRFKDLFEKTDNHWDVPLKDKYSIEDDGKYSQRVKFEWQVSVGEQAKKIVGLLSPYRYRLK